MTSPGSEELLLRLHPIFNPDLPEGILHLLKGKDTKIALRHLPGFEEWPRRGRQKLEAQDTDGEMSGLIPG